MAVLSLLVLLTVASERLGEEDERRREDRVREKKLKQLTEAIPVVADVLRLISQRYEYDKPVGRMFMLMQSSLSEEHFDHLKYTLAKKVLANERSKYLMVTCSLNNKAKLC